MFCKEIQEAVLSDGFEAGFSLAQEKIRDADGRLVPRKDYRLTALNCGGEDFAVACMRSNLRYGKNQKREDVKRHHYIISIAPATARAMA